MVGTGNDFLVVDARRPGVKILRRQWPAMSRAFCDRRYGIGADGLLVLEPSRLADVTMRIFNADGSKAEMCGNGARCIALYVAKNKQRSEKWKVKNRTHVTIETRAGTLQAVVRGDRVALEMTQPTDVRLDQIVEVNGQRLRFGFINTGVPHVVVPVDSVEAVDVERLGRALRQHPRFAPRGANVNFIQLDPRHPGRIRVRTYERGVEAETLACGTGVTASALVYALAANGHGASSRVRVTPKSGEELTVSFRIAGHGRERRIADVVLEGPAQRVFETVVTWPRQGTS